MLIDALETFDLGYSSISVTSGKVLITKDNWDDAKNEAAILNKILSLRIEITS
jgi:hypothetical protein